MLQRSLVLLVVLALLIACDRPPAVCDEPTAARVVFDYDCGPDDAMVTLSAWLGDRFVGAVAKGCDAGTLRVKIDAPGTWHIEARIGAQPTVECDTSITAAMIDTGSELGACE